MKRKEQARGAKLNRAFKYFGEQRRSKAGSPDQVAANNAASCALTANTSSMIKLTLFSPGRSVTIFAPLLLGAGKKSDQNDATASTDRAAIDKAYTAGRKPAAWRGADACEVWHPQEARAKS